MQNSLLSNVIEGYSDFYVIIYDLKYIYLSMETWVRKKCQKPNMLVRWTKFIARFLIISRYIDLSFYARLLISNGFE